MSTREVLCVGQLLHHFHGGEYTGTIYLSPEAEKDIPLILATFTKLGYQFERAKGIGASSRFITMNVTSADINRLKGTFAAWSLRMRPCGFRHCGKRCKAKLIDACQHSVDYGPDFEISVPVELDTSMTLGLPGVT